MPLDDIRSFFNRTPAAPKASSLEKEEPVSTRPKRSTKAQIIISDDDEDDFVPSRTPASKRTRSSVHTISSDEGDLVSVQPTPKRGKKSTSAGKQKLTATKVKDINPSDYFSSPRPSRSSSAGSTKLTNPPKPKSSKPKVVDAMDLDSDSDIIQCSVTDPPTSNVEPNLAPSSVSSKVPTHPHSTPMKSPTNPHSTVPVHSTPIKSPTKTGSQHHMVATPYYKDAFNSKLQAFMSQPRSMEPSDPGASTPSSSEIPEGQENCLHGLTFVVTGEFEQLDRKGIEDYIKKFSGRVTTAVSSKTSYLIVGEAPGESKKSKAIKLKTPMISIEKMFDMVRTRSRVDASQVEKSKSKAQISRDLEVSAISTPPVNTSSALWTDKYRPTKASEIIGNKGLVEKLRSWLTGFARARQSGFKYTGEKNFTHFKAVLISGPPGIGKTTAAHILVKEAGYGVLEYNASDMRSKKSMDEVVMPVIDNHTLFAPSNSHDHVIIMDEVDGMSGSDRGGLAELSVLIKNTRVPIICICNDRSSPKMKTLASKCLELRFARPDANAIRSRLMTICHREGLAVQPNALDVLVQSTRSDIRQIIHLLSTYRLCSKSLQYENAQTLGHGSEKDCSVGMFDAIKQILTPGVVRSATMSSMIEQYFVDYDMVPLMMHENYLHVRASTNPIEELTRISAAADAIAVGDQINSLVRGQQQWSLLNAHAIFSTVKPAFMVCTGNTCSGSHEQHQFTSVLGNLSKFNKYNRIVTGLEKRIAKGVHGASPGQAAVRLDYVPVLSEVLHTWWAAGEPKKMCGLMDAYYLGREDLDEVLELRVGPKNGKAMLEMIPAKDKAAFTRMYNGAARPVFSVAVPTSKRGVAEAGVEDEEFVGEEEEEEEEVDPEVLKKALAKQQGRARAKGSKASGRVAKGK